MAGESRIQRELKQSKPFPTRAEEAAVSLLRTADMLRRMIGALIEPEGITAQQYNVLRILRGAGEAGLPTLDIAERMIEQTPGITRLVDRLEAKSLVRRDRCPTDRRQVFCRITPAALELLARLDDPVSRIDRGALTALGNRELDSLVAMLDRAREKMHAELSRIRGEGLLSPASRASARVPPAEKKRR
jgi:DNA-binding MarR family transcriptional regulator